MKRLFSIGLLFLLFGCLQSEWKTIAGNDSVIFSVLNKTNLTPGKPVEIGSFSVVDSYYTDDHTLSFSLLDENGISVKSDGNAKVVIKEGDKTLFQDSFNVKSSDFEKDASLGIFGQGDTYKYSWDFNGSNLTTNNISSYYADGELTFTTKDGKTFKKTATISLGYNYSSSGSSDIYNSTNLTVSKTFPEHNDTEVTLISHGIYNSGYYYSQNSYRLDVKVSNKGQAKKYLEFKSAAIVTKEGKQYSGYDNSYNYGGDLFPGASNSHELVFDGLESIPQDEVSLYLELYISAGNSAYYYDEPLDEEYITLRIDFNPSLFPLK